MVKPTKMRNRQIYRASQALRSRQVSANLSKGLRSKYGRRSIRVVEGDTVMIKRGEYADVPGKVEKIDIASGRISVAGVKKEKAKGDKFDVMMHASNVLVTGLNLSDQRRRDKIGATGEYETDETVDGAGAGAATGAATAADGTATADAGSLPAETPGDAEAGAGAGSTGDGKTAASDETGEDEDGQDGDAGDDTGAADESDGWDDEGGDGGDGTGADRDDGSQGDDGGQADKTKQNRPGDEA